jgi:RNA polymerase primary sigma factor
MRVFKHGSRCVSTYLQEIGGYTRPIPQEEQANSRPMRPSKPEAPAYHELVHANLGFVVKVAGEYRNRGLPLEDLLNEGNIGLIEAARRFDPTREAKFVTYAVWWIRKSILSALSQQTLTVRVTEYHQKQERQVRTTESRLARELGRDADREEISRELRTTTARIDALLQVRRRELSLDDKVGIDGTKSILDCLVDERSPNPEEEILRHESGRLVRRALRKLNTQERFVIVHRFGLQGDRACTLREIGVRLGLSHERVRQIETQAMGRLRSAMTVRHRRAAAGGSSPGEPQAAAAVGRPVVAVAPQRRLRRQVA